PGGWHPRQSARRDVSMWRCRSVACARWAPGRDTATTHPSSFHPERSGYMRRKGGVPLAYWKINQGAGQEQDNIASRGAGLRAGHVRLSGAPQEPDAASRPASLQTRPAARARAYARHPCPGRRSEPEETPRERSPAPPLLRPEHLPPARAPDPVPETALTSDAAPGYCETRPYPHGPAARYAPALPYRSPATLRTCSGRRVPSTRRCPARTRAALLHSASARRAVRVRRYAPRSTRPRGGSRHGWRGRGRSWNRPR